MFFSRAIEDSETVVGMIASALRRDIAFGDLAPGTRLKIDDLRTRYGGSSHSMRGALTRLAAEGLVEATAQRGFRVSSATDDDLRDIMRLRCEIEKLGLAWSFENGGVDWEGRVMAAHHRLARAQDAVEADAAAGALAWDEAHKHFHEALISSCGSRRLLSIQQQLYDQSRQFRFAQLRTGEVDFAKMSVEHRQLVEAVLRRDVAAALASLHQNIQGGPLT